MTFPPFSVSQRYLDELFLVRNAAEVLHRVHDPAENFLVGQAVERAGQAVHGRRQGVVGVRQGRADEVAGVGRDVAAFVVAVDVEVQPHQVIEIGLVVADLVGQVGRPVELRVGGDVLGALVAAHVDAGRDLGQLGDDVHDIFEHRIPVVCLVHAVPVAGGELGVFLEGQDGQGELGHRVQVLRERFEHLDAGSRGAWPAVFHSSPTARASSRVGTSPVSRR